MNTRIPFSLFVTVLSGVAFSAENTRALSLDDAQQASGRSFDEVRAADTNGDQIIDAAEFASLTGAPETGYAPPAGEAPPMGGLPVDTPSAE